MTPSAWIALASLACVITVNAVVVAFVLGKTIQRVSTLERDNGALLALSNSFARMESDMKHLTSSVDELKGKLAWATEVAPAGRSAR